MSMMYQVKIQATGEVRDAEGKLVSTEPIEAIMTKSAAELEELGIPIPEEK